MSTGRHEPGMGGEPARSPPHPPTTQGRIGVPARAPGTRWPTALGVIGVVYGVVGFACAMISSGLVEPTWTSYSATGSLQVSGGALSPMLRRTLSVGAVIGVLCAVGMIAGSIGLFSRRAWSGRAMVIGAIGFAGFSAVCALAFSAIQHRMTKEQLTQSLQQAAASGAGPAAPVTPMQVDSVAWTTAAIVFVFMLSVSLPWPAAIIAWMMRPSVRAQISSWKSARKKVLTGVGGSGGSGGSGASDAL